MDNHEGSMDVDPKETQPLVGENRLNLVANQQKSFLYSGFTNLPFIIAIAVILGDSDDDCDSPIRTWLIVMLITISVPFLAGLVELCTGLLSKIGGWVTVPLLLLMLFNIAWYIVGSAWLFGDDDCYDDWKDGYILTLVMLIFFYVAFGILALVVCCCCCCVGIFAGAAGAASLAAPNEENRS